MKSTIKFKATAISIATVLTFTLMSLFRITPSSSAAPAVLTFPAGANKIVSRTFQAPNGVPVIVIVRLKNNGVLGSDPAKRLTVKVSKPDGSLAKDKWELVNPGETKQVVTQDQLTRSSLCGNWKVEVTNPNDNATNATATVTIEFNFVPITIADTDPMFSVMQGQTETRIITIPQSGDLTISGTWAPGNDRLRFRLLKGDSGPLAVADYGYGGPHPDQLNLKYRVTQQDIQTYGSRWKLEVKEYLGQANVQNIRLAKIFTPACY